MRLTGKIALFLFTTRCTTATVDRVLTILVDRGEIAPRDRVRIERNLDRLAAAS